MSEQKVMVLAQDLFRADFPRRFMPGPNSPVAQLLRLVCPGQAGFDPQASSIYSRMGIGSIVLSLSDMAA